MALVSVALLDMSGEMSSAHKTRNLRTYEPSPVVAFVDVITAETDVSKGNVNNERC